MGAGTYIFLVGVDVRQRGVVKEAEGRSGRALFPEVGGLEEVRGLDLMRV